MVKHAPFFYIKIERTVKQNFAVLHPKKLKHTI